MTDGQGGTSLVIQQSRVEVFGLRYKNLRIFFSFFFSFLFTKAPLSSSFQNRNRSITEKLLISSSSFVHIFQWLSSSLRRIKMLIFINIILRTFVVVVVIVCVVCVRQFFLLFFPTNCTKKRLLYKKKLLDTVPSYMYKNPFFPSRFLFSSTVSTFPPFKFIKKEISV